MADDVGGDEAVWQDLVARFSTVTADGEGPAPWPAREDLAAPPPPVPGDPVMGPLPRPARPRPPGRGPAVPGPDGPEAGAGSPDSDGGDPADSRDPGGSGDPGDSGAAPAAGPGTAGPGQSGADRVRARIIRPAASRPPGDEDAGDHYVPPPPPPLPALDPVAKGAWAALFGGPAYLLVAVMAGWAVPGWAAFLAVAAFVGGFATLVVRMGDEPPRDSGPDNGAVV